MSRVVNVVVIGDTQCGKTSLLTSFFKSSHRPDEEVPNFEDYVTTSLELDGELFSLELRDTVSSEACRRFFLDLLNSAQRSLDISIHLLAAQIIGRTIKDIHKRGVQVRVICDNEFATNRGSQIFYLLAFGIPIKVPAISHHMHNKLAIIDQSTILSGSVNWTSQGFFNNWENIVITTQEEIVRDVVTAFEKMWNHPDAQKVIQDG